MKHKLYILAVALMASAVSSDAFAYAHTFRTNHRDIMELLYKPSISYNKDVVESPGWKGNWFVGVNGGINALLGTPMGCNDLGGRIKGQFGINAGKWFTPTAACLLPAIGSTMPRRNLRTVGAYLRKYSGISQTHCTATMTRPASV